jgi:hypothetical protein
MGDLKKPAISDYWDTGVLFETPGIRTIFFYDEFSLIDRFFQIEDFEQGLEEKKKDPF